MGNKPVNFVSWYDSIRFANWLHNGQGNGDTETGAYTLGTLPPVASGIPINGLSIARNAGAKWFLPSENELYKAAYHLNDGATGNYFDYPTSSFVAPVNEAPAGGSNSANYNFVVGDSTNVGAYTDSDSPYGTFDQGGNVFEWNETLIGSTRGLRGGSWLVNASYMNASYRGVSNPAEEFDNFGFRVAFIPEPSSFVLAAVGLIGLVVWRRRKRPKSGVAALTVLLSIFAADVQGVTIDWVPVGNPGNLADPADGDFSSSGIQHLGAVPNAFRIGKYDVTTSQYVEFLNTKDAAGANLLGLYNPVMSHATFGGIRFTAANPSGSKYSAVAGRENYPANATTWYNAIRFANWLNNGQGNANTETGAYTLLGGTAVPSNGSTLTRNAGAIVFLPSENEWYKAAYYNPGNQSYFQYPTSSNIDPNATLPTSAPNSANKSDQVGDLTQVGAYSGTTSPYGAFDMGGNVYQWNEALFGSSRGLRGGSFFDSALHSSVRTGSNPADGNYYFGFRVASVPEPSSFVLAAIGLIGLVVWRRRKR